MGDLAERGLLVHAGLYEHRYPHCWRCDTPLIFRISDDWFLSVEELRGPLLDANATVEWTPAYMGKRMDDWLRNMGDWNISRRRYYGLPLPFYPCGCGQLNVIGSKAELLERATAPAGELEELRRPWVDAIRIRCESCGGEVERIAEVGDVWLDAGIVPFSTLGWESREYVREGYATGAARGLTSADLPDHAYWEEWFPADWVSEMREQIRLWFYSQLFMSVALTGRAPFRKVLGYEKMLDETGREMHGSWGNMIDAQDAFGRMGADVMRWQYCAQPPDRNLLFGFGPAREIQRRLLTLWNSVTFLVQYGNIDAFTPRLADLEGVDAELDPLDRWLVERVRLLVEEATDGYERWLTGDVVRAFEAFVDDLSNWYIRCSRRRFWNGEETALRVLWHGLAQSLRVVAPMVPFLTEHLWQVLVREPCEGAADSVFLAGWPARATPDASVLEAMADARRIVDLGRTARSTSGVKLRQPLPRLVVEGATLGATASRRSSARSSASRLVELGRVDVGARRQAEPARPRPEARQGARRRPCGSGGGRVRRPRRRPVPRRRPGALARRRPRRALGAGGLGGRLLRRGDRRARYPIDEGLELGGAGLRADPPRQHHAQGGGAGAHRPHRARRSRPRTRTCSSTPIGSRKRRSPRRSRRRATRPRSPGPEPEPLSAGPGLRELELAAQLDGEPERHVLVHHPVRLDLLDAAGAEPVTHPGDEPLRRRGTRGDPDRLDAVEPGAVDLCLVVDQVRRDSGARATSTSRFEFDELREPITSRRSISPACPSPPTGGWTSRSRCPPSSAHDGREASAERPDDLGGLVDRQRRLRHVGDGRAIGQLERLRLATSCTRIVASGASPIVPTTSS